jgi:hypothetical protein
MNCYRCKLPMSEFSWATRSNKGVRHIQCPSKNGKRAKERAAKRRKYLASLRTTKS